MVGHYSSEWQPIHLLLPLKQGHVFTVTDSVALMLPLTSIFFLLLATVWSQNSLMCSELTLCLTSVPLNYSLMPILSLSQKEMLACH